MADKGTLEDAGYLGGESMIYEISALGAQDPNAGQAIYVEYEAHPSAALLHEVDMFSGHYVLQSDESDVLTSMLCENVTLGQQEISIVDGGSLLGGSLCSVQTICSFNEENVSSGAMSVTSGSLLESVCHSSIGPESSTGGSSGSSAVPAVSFADSEFNRNEEIKTSIYSSIQATLSPDFIKSADDSFRDVLQKTMKECHLQMVHSPETDMCYILGWRLDDLVHLERIICHLLHVVDDPSQKQMSQSTSTEEVEKPQTCDKQTSCSLIRPQFSRSGREIRFKEYHSYEDGFEADDLRVENLVAAQPADAEKVRKKRGRPRKLVQNLDVRSDFGDTLSNDRNTVHVKTQVEIPEKDSSDVPVEATESDLGWKQTEKDQDESLHLPVEPISQETEVCREKRSTNEDGQNNVSVYEELRSESLSSSRRKDYESRAPFKFCPSCSFKTKRESHLQKHIQLHDRNVPILRCTNCSFCTTRRNHLTRHEMLHKSSVYRCDRAGCAYKTDSQRLLQRHTTLRHSATDRGSERNKASPVSLECPMRNCNYKTNRAHLIRRHLVRHTDVDGNGDLVEQYSCSICSYMTKFREHYLRHINAVHSNLRPYLCDNCGRSFKRKDSLAQHSIVHVDKNNRSYQFECQTCHTKFRSQGHLQDHQAKHTSNRSYLCEICGASFKTKAVQRKHIISIHSNPRSFICSVCSRRFNTSFALRRHSASHNAKGGSTSSAAVPLQETVSVATASRAVQVTVVTGLPSVDGFQSGLVNIQPRLASLDASLGNIPTHMVLGAPHIFALDADDQEDKSTSQYLQQTF